MSDRTFLDWPFFDEAHRALARQAAAWADAEVPEAEPGEDGLDAACRDLVAALGAAGWLRYVVPASHGGVHPTLDVRSLCLLRETLAGRSGLADFAFAMQGLGSAPIGLYGSDALKDRYLPPVAEGRRIAAFALSEPDAGSDVAAMATTAERRGDAYVLNGVKTWISNAGLADHYVVFARTGGAPGAKGLGAFVVDRDAPGLEVAARIPLIAPHPLGRLELRDCRVPAENMLGAPGDGFAIAMGTLDVFRSSVGAAALGFARRALDEATARARTRRTFGRAIAEHQMIRAKIADMAVRVDAAALLVYRAAWTRDSRGGRVTREASMAKLYATEAAQAVIDEAVQIFGGEGVVAGAPVERLYREIRALRIYEGTSEIQRLVIAAKTLEAAEEAAAGKAGDDAGEDRR